MYKGTKRNRERERLGVLTTFNAQIEFKLYLDLKGIKKKLPLLRHKHNREMLVVFTVNE